MSARTRPAAQGCGAAYGSGACNRRSCCSGPPGSGKGTQAERLRDELGYVWLSTGELLRAARAAGTEVGRRAAEYMDRGDLVPDELVIATLRDAVADHESRPVLFDGFPRTVEQADALNTGLEARGRKLTAVVLVDVPDDVVAERISGRGREDDRPETVRERLLVYHRDTAPLVDYYDERGLLRRIDGAQGPDAVHDDVRAALA